MKQEDYEIALSCCFRCVVEITTDDREEAVRLAMERLEKELPRLLDGEDISALYGEDARVKGTFVDSVEEW